MDLNCLFETHRELEEAESQVMTELDRVCKSATAPPESELLRLLTGMVRFDGLLMNHLGEEEEVIVPMTLAPDRWSL